MGVDTGCQEATSSAKSPFQAFKSISEKRVQMKFAKKKKKIKKIKKEKKKNILGKCPEETPVKGDISAKLPQLNHVNTTRISNGTNSPN